MSLRKPINFLFQTVTVALAAIVVILFLKPELLQRGPTVVEFKESAPRAVRRSEPVQRLEPASTPAASYAGAVEAASPAVVNIYTAKVVRQRASPLFDDPLFRQFFGEQTAPRQRLQTSLGSGVILSAEGYIATNNHVIEGADKIQVQMRDGRRADAVVVGADPDTDLAVLKVGLGDLASITLSQGESLRVGDVVLAIGNPFGVGQTVTMGIVSATGRSQLGINTFEDFIQTDAAVNPGNSGGALVNTYGELVGINTAIFSETGASVGIGFAIPVSLARDVMQEIIEHGRVIRGWLGVEAQDLTPELAESFGLGDTRGVILAGILREGPADRAGLQPGDIILGLDGRPLDDSRDLLNRIAKIRPGSALQARVLRRGKELKLVAKVGERAPRRQ